MKRRVMLTVCANARDKAEAREFLLMLGLLGEEYTPKVLNPGEVQPVINWSNRSGRLR